MLTRTPFDLAPAKQLVFGALADLGLQLNLEKTRTTTFDRFFRFVGAEIQGDAILLPFDKKKTPLSPVFVAPTMPSAVLRAWRAGHIKADRPFVRPSPVPPAERKARRATNPHTAVLARLAGPGGGALRRRSGPSSR